MLARQPIPRTLAELASWISKYFSGNKLLQIDMSQLSNGTPFLSGSGVPLSGIGANGQYYFRTDTPGTVNQRIYVKSAGAWVGIL